MSGQVVESDEVPDHADGLVEGAVTIVGRVSVLLKEVVLQKLGNFQSDLVSFGQRGFADQLSMLTNLISYCQWKHF